MWWLIEGILLALLIIVVVASRYSNKVIGSDTRKPQSQHRAAKPQERSGPSISYGSPTPSQGGGYDANSNGPFGTSSQAGVDYPSSWHGPNEPGGSLDI